MRASLELALWVLITLSADVWRWEPGSERAGDGILVSIVFKF